MIKRKIKRKRIYLFSGIIFLVTLTFIACAYFFPMGKIVLTVVSVTPATVSINGCSISDYYLLRNNANPSSEYDGNRIIVIFVFSGQTELFKVQKEGVGYVGSYTITTPVLPSTLDLNTPLNVKVQLLSANGTLLSEDEKTIIYR
ncbi:MAG: hypothetical protein QXZ70_08125 [Candidatus Bathyarchaeia archaeon]